MTPADVGPILILALMLAILGDGIFVFLWLAERFARKDRDAALEQWRAWGDEQRHDEERADW